ncbi:hypothetical protein BH23ACT5_BH23ACT5_14080 [soil metagenome]
MRSRAIRRVALTLAFLLLVPVRAGAQQSFVSCWVEARWNPTVGRNVDVTVCRLADGSTGEYDGVAPPGPVSPSVGADATGVCWFWTSAGSEWVILSTFGDGSAILGIYVDGFLVVDTGQVPRCTSEPVVVDPPPVHAWEAITEYIHDPPSPDLSPPPGLGLTGMETYAGFPVPGPWSNTLIIPGYTIDVEVRVGAVSVDWGDGTTDVYPPETYPMLTGYPDGLAHHVFEAKTCQPAGGGRACHPSLEAYPVTVAYHWEARWRANGAEWVTVTVPPSSTGVTYPVAEVVSSLLEVG